MRRRPHVAAAAGALLAAVLAASCGTGGGGSHPASARPAPAAPTGATLTAAWRARTLRVLEARLATEGPYPAFLAPQQNADPLRVADAAIALGPGQAPSGAAAALLRRLWQPQAGLFAFPGSAASDLYATALVLRALAAEHAQVPGPQARRIVEAVARHAAAGGRAAALDALRVVAALARDAQANALAGTLAALRARLRPPVPCASTRTLAAAAAAFELARLAGAACPAAAVARVRPLGALAVTRWNRLLRRGAVLDVGAAVQLTALAELARAGAAPRARVRRLVAETLAAQASPASPPVLDAAGAETTLRLLLDAARATGAARGAPARPRALLARTVRWLGRLPQLQTGDALNTVAGIHALAALGAAATARRLAEGIRLGAVADPSERMLLAAGLAPRRLTARLLVAVAGDAAIDGTTRLVDVAIAIAARPDLCAAAAVQRLVAGAAPDLARLPALAAAAGGAELVQLAFLASVPERCGLRHGASARAAIAKRLRALARPGGVAATPGGVADLVSTWDAVEAACLVGARPALGGGVVHRLLASALDAAGGTRLGAGPGGATIATYAAVRVVGAVHDGCRGAFFRPLGS